MLFYRRENIVRKGENAGIQHLLLSDNVFKRRLSHVMKGWHCVVKHQSIWLLVVLGFNATLTAKVISWRSVMHMCFLAFSHQY